MTEGRSDREAETALVAEVAAGSHDALAILYDRHAVAIHALARRMTADRQIAEEVVQETFLALWNRAELYDPNVGSLGTWLYAIARNRIVDRLRAAGRRPTLVPLSSVGDEGTDATTVLERTVEAGTVVGGATDAPGPEAAAEAAETRAVVGRALESMPAAERTVIELAYRAELTQSEIAARLGWPLGTVKTRTRRALGRLRVVLAPMLGDAAAPASPAAADEPVHDEPAHEDVVR